MYNFDALMSRLKYIPRWSLMRQANVESVARHTFETAMLAHTLGLLAKEVFSRDVNSDRLVVAALYHDASEILTGDMPTPVKYSNERLKTAYKDMEMHAVESLAGTSHPRLKKDLLSCMTGESLTDYDKKLLKAADKISALIKCIEERESGNREFDSAYTSTLKAIKDMKLEEADFFLENMVDAYSLCLDQLCEI